MADKGPGSTGRSQKKRLARAKIKPTDEGIKSSKGRSNAVVEEMTKTQKAAERKKKLTAIGVGIFAVIMALSMMLPSLSYIFGSPQEQQAAQEEEAAQAAKEEAKDDAGGEAKDSSSEGGEEATEETTDVTNDVDGAYKAVVDPLEAKLAENPEDLATLLNLGKEYMSWGSQVASSASDDAAYEHATELFSKSMEYYDSYLELNDSPAVKVDRAMCQLYTGDLEGATAALETLAKDENYGPAWANLGMVYELYQQDTTAAKKAYKKAIKADPDDEYGSKSYANRRLAAMAAQQNNGKLEEEGTTADTSTESAPEGAAALEDALETGK